MKYRLVRCRIGKHPEIAIFEDIDFDDIINEEVGPTSDSEWFGPDESYVILFPNTLNQQGNRLGITGNFVVVSEDRESLTSEQAGGIIDKLIACRDPGKQLRCTYDRFLGQTKIAAQFDGFTIEYDDSADIHDSRPTELYVKPNENVTNNFHMLVFLLKEKYESAEETRWIIKLNAAKRVPLSAEAIAGICDASLVEVALIGDEKRIETSWNYVDQERFMCLLAEAHLIEPNNLPPSMNDALCQRCQRSRRDPGGRYCDECAEAMLKEMKRISKRSE